MAASSIGLPTPSPNETTAARNATPSPWLVSPRFDVGFFLLSGLVVLVPWIATGVFNVDPYLVLSAVAVVANGPHLSSTWSRVYLDTRELRRRPVAVVVIPALIAAVIITTIWMTPDAYRLFTSIILYWATYHFAAQCYGLLRLYQRKSGEAPSLTWRAEAAFIYAIAATALMYRVHFGPRTLFNIVAYTPPVPLALVIAGGLVTVALALYVLVHHSVRAREGRAVPWPRLAFLGATALGFGVPFFLIRDGTAGFAAAACWHGIQYLGIVYHYNRNKFREGPSVGGARLISWVSQPGRAVAYGALMLALVGAVYGGVFVVAHTTGFDLWRTSLATWVTLTLSHYWIDGVIWKMRRDEQNRDVLAV